MKFLAILRDSLREALDAKVLYALLGLALLVVVAFASISFTPESREKGMRAIHDRLPGAKGPFGKAGPVRYDLEKFEASDAARPWQGSYNYTLVVTETPPQGADDGDKNEKDEKGEKKDPAPPRRPRPAGLPDDVSLFRFLVLMSSLEDKGRELTDEDKQRRKRMQGLFVQAMMMGPNPPPEKAKKLADEMFKEVKGVGTAELEGFVRNQLAAAGSLDATVKLEDEAPRTFRFAVECKPKAEAAAAQAWPRTLSLLFGAVNWPGEVSLGTTVFLLQDTLIGGIGAALALLLSVVITAFFIPNMLRKGTVDLLIAKPISRPTLLIFKYLGGLSFMVVTTAFTVLGIWVVLGVRSGLWSTGFLITSAVLVFQFALFYAVSTFLGVTSRSPILAILGTCAVYGVLFVVPFVQAILKPFHEMNALPGWVYPTVDTARLVLPRYKDLDRLGSDLVARDLLPADSAERKGLQQAAADLRWDVSLGVTGAYIALLLAVSCWWFSTKDY